jgi:hypothetical protein
LVSSVNSATTGVGLNSVTGTFSAATGGIMGSTGTAFQVGSSNATISYVPAIFTTAGKGVDLTSNTGSTISFTGTLTFSSGSAIAFNATGGGTVTATDTSSTLTTTTGTALNVANTTIGASNLSFRSISANGGTNGIVLNNTGSAGGLKVLGTGAASSGGTIQNTTADAIQLTNTQHIALAWMNIQNIADDGVDGTSLTDFSFTNGTINNVGTAAHGAPDESGIALDDSVSFTESNVSGAVTITGNTITNARRHGVSISNWSGTVSNLNISNNTLSSSTSAAVSLGNALNILAQGSASTTAHITGGSIANNTISNFPSGAGIFVAGGNTGSATSATLGVPGGSAISITGNKIAGASAANLMGTNAIAVTFNGCNGQSNFDISNNGTVANPITNIAGVVVSVFMGGNVNATATVNGNVVVSHNTAGSSGIAVQADQSCAATDAPVVTATMNNNSVSSNDGNGIRGIARNSNGTLKLKVQNNTVTAPLTANRDGIRVDSGSAVGNTTLCLNITGNTSAGSGLSKGIGLRKQGAAPATNVFGINGMAATASPGVEAYVDGLNPADGGSDLISATSGFSNCSLP